VKPFSESQRTTIRESQQRELIEVLSLHRHPKAGELIERASADDLAWFQQMSEHQLEETPHRVRDEAALEKIQG
jgi:hypothetical protein